MATSKKSIIKKSAVKRSGAKSPAAKKAGSGKKVVDKAAAKAKSAGKQAAAKPLSKAATASASPLQAGRTAPDFNLQDDTGRAVTLGDFRGKKVILYFYPKDSTPGCTRESCDFRDNLGRLTGKGAIVLGLSADSVESHRKFKSRQALNFPLLSDPERRALEAYGVWQEKSLYGRKFMGIVRTTVIIDEKGRIAKVFPKVKVEGHVDEVIASL